MIDEKLVKNFWSKRGEKIKTLPFEAVANLEEDPALLELKIRLEQQNVLPRLALAKSMKVLDLGAGCGQWTFRFAPLVASVTAVEYTKELVAIGEDEARRRGANNVKFIVSPAEDFRTDQQFDLVFISGLFVYLTDNQAAKLLKNLKSFLRTESPQGKVFLRDGTSILPQRHYIQNRFSNVLQTNYSAVYRTRDEYIALFKGAGLILEEEADMFDEGCPLNKYPETRLRIYKFALGECK